ncbi:MAG TPA: RHS repeat domain-containing protein [Chitinophaga sp.]|uniref:RHS repeat domain-containing protein n=1 Tax=Chitinophaga sp. TaxID=1869181 RepID=UPI002BD49688|nr:RHS repeat domain-containing protein [Chitinophaga sp.]HVI44864.1 RHS repeat domain-containing protein [Chitinophaga sp.]
MKKTLILHLLLFTLIAAYGQYQNKVPAVTPVSPNSATLFRVLERPIGTYTGTVPVSFPLFTFTSGTLSMQFSLNYNNTGGVRIEEEAGNLGLGFTIPNANNRITRIIKGLADDAPRGMLNNTSKKPSTFSWIDMPYVNEYYRGDIDLEPDLFLFNFNGYTGSFFFKENGSIVLMQNTPLEINPIFETDGSISGWKVYDDLGSKYFFGKNESGSIKYIDKTSVSYQSNTDNFIPPTGYNSGWPLQEIHDMNDQNKIVLSYDYTSTVLKTISGAFQPMQKISAVCNGFNLVQDQIFVTSTINEYTLSKVEGESGTVFIYNSTNRSDVQGGSRLGAIDFYDPVFNIIKRFRFDYDYFNPGGGPFMQRLKLTGLKEYNITQTDSLQYKFEYSGVSLPARLSFAVDYWGFANGQLGNNIFLPNISYTYGGITYNATGFSNRNVFAAYAEAGVLNKITYPTGGYRKFFYEGNQALVLPDDQIYPDITTPLISTPNGNWVAKNRNVGGIRVKEIQDFDPVTGKINKTRYQYKLYSIDSTLTSGLLITPVRVANIENTDITCIYMKLYPSSCYPLATSGGSYVVYPEVRTIEDGNGWIDRRYSYARDILPSVNEYPIVPVTDQSYLRGQLLDEKYYNNSGTLLRKKSWAYGFTTITGEQVGLKVKAYFKSPGSTEYREKPDFANELPVLAAGKTYSLAGQFRLLFQESDSTFTTSGAFGQTTKYAWYSDADYFTNFGWRPIKQTSVLLNNGITKSKTYRYCFNDGLVFPLSAHDYGMRLSLFIKRYYKPMEEVDSLKTGSVSKFMGGTEYIFNDQFTDTFHLAQVRTYTSFTDSTEINFTYDSIGNIVERYPTMDVKEAYLWGYNYQYPVAKVTGGDYVYFITLVDNSVIQNSNTPDAAMRSELNKIRTALKGRALVTTYTYNQFGISSETDASGMTTTYEYDSFGRLILIRNMDGKILKHFEYKYTMPYTY